MCVVARSLTFRIRVRLVLFLLRLIRSFSPSNAAYRAKLASVDYPKLPYFGVFLRDLHFIDLGNDTWVGGKETGVVNFEKVTRMEALLNELDTFKTYTGEPLFYWALQIFFLSLISPYRIRVSASPSSSSISRCAPVTRRRVSSQALDPVGTNHNVGTQLS